MPQNKNSKAPPEVMTWGKASLVLIIAGVFDLLRAFFNLFWFFGPAIAAIYCSSKVSGWVGSMWGLTDAACTAVAGAAGFYFSPIIAAFGVVMADAVALLGFLFLILLVLMTNTRILKTVQTAMMQIGASFGVAALPLIGAIPTFSITLYKLYRRQIKIETAAYKKWEKDHANEQIQQRQQQAAQLIQNQQDQVAQAQLQQIANDEMSAAMEQKKEPREVTPEDEETYRPAPVRTITRLATVPDYTGTSEIPSSSSQNSPAVRSISTASRKVEPVSIPRRDFTKKAAVLAGGSAVGAYATPPSVIKTKETSALNSARQTYEQGIERLRKEVLSAEREHAEVFMVKKDGTSSWLKIPENEKNPSPDGDSTSGKFIKSIADDGDVAHFDIVHIRPSQSVSHDSSRAPQTQKEAAPLATPPSVSDLTDMVTSDGETSRRPGTIVVDPTGVWKAELVGDPKALLSAKQKSQIPETPSMSDFISKIEMASGKNIVLDTDEKLKEMQDMYSGVGVNLTFTPHPKKGGSEIPERVREAM